MFERIVRLCSAFLVTTFIAGGASAAELTIGSRATPTIDPHFLFLTSNVHLAAVNDGRRCDAKFDARGDLRCIV